MGRKTALEKFRGYFCLLLCAWAIWSVGNQFWNGIQLGNVQAGFGVSDTQFALICFLLLLTPAVHFIMKHWAPLSTTVHFGNLTVDEQRSPISACCILLNVAIWVLVFERVTDFYWRWSLLWTLMEINHYGTFSIFALRRQTRDHLTDKPTQPSSMPPTR